MGSQTGGADHVNNFENVAWNKESPVYLLQNEPAPLHVCGEGGGRKEKTPAVNEEVRMEGFGEDEPEPWWVGGGAENGCESSECRLARRGCLPQSEKWDQSGKTQQIMSKRGSSHFKIHRHVRTLGVDTDAAPCCCVMLSLWLQDVKPLRPSDGLFVRLRISITRSKCALHG